MTLTVAVLGNCQAEGVAASLQAMLPEASVWHQHWGLLREAGALAAVADRASSADVVFTQVSAWEKTGPLQTDQLKQRARKLITYPKFHFSGLQPDALWIHKKHARSPLGSSFHSKLVLAAYLRGLKPAHAASLFNAYFYTLLGYFEEYRKAVAFNIVAARDHGVDLQDRLAGWRHDVFMHSPNHPKIQVLAAIAEAVAHKAGLTTRPDAPLPPDPLQKEPQWPIYPEIGERLGVDGAMQFQLRVEGERRSFYNIDQVVRRAFANYDKADREWLAKVPEIRHTVSVLEAAGA